MSQDKARAEAERMDRLDAYLHTVTADDRALTDWDAGFSKGWNDALAWQAAQPVTVTAEQVEAATRRADAQAAQQHSLYWRDDFLAALGIEVTP